MMLPFNMHYLTPVIILISFMSFNSIAFAYPIDAYPETGIGRLEYARRVEANIMPGTKLPPGALLSTEQVDLRLLDYKELELPEIDADFTRQIVELMGDKSDRYSISVLDLSDMSRPRYAEHRGNETANPGSVGKLMVVMALFQLLADQFKTDIEARRELLHDTVITSDEFVLTDHHTVAFWDNHNERRTRHILHPGDRGTLWEFLDWMMSASSNAAASTVIKQTMLMKQFGENYPVPEQQSQQFFKETSRTELGKILAAALYTPVTRNNLDINHLRQGSFFTATGQKRVPGARSYATSRELIRFLLKLEQGKIVDEFSSREIKRLMYLTERRIRYASSPALNEAAVYFKSGSYYQCKPEPDFNCLKYHGNVKNLMNSVAIIESPAKERKIYYLVALMSNVLRFNSAVDHQTLATRIHRLIENYHKTKFNEAERMQTQQEKK